MYSLFKGHLVFWQLDRLQMDQRVNEYVYIISNCLSLENKS